MSGMGACRAVTLEAFVLWFGKRTSRRIKLRSRAVRSPAVPSPWAPVRAEVFASRTAVRVGSRESLVWRSQDRSVRPRAAWVGLFRAASG